jgi:peptidyl-dipeptidase Dcp
MLNACTQAVKNEDMTNNPFMQPSGLPYNAPDFAKIEVGHFKPAIEAGITQHLAEIDSIANNPETAAFDNTIVAMEKSGQLLSRAFSVFNLLAGADTNDEMQALQEEISPQIAALSNAIYLNNKLFARIKSIYDRRESLSLDAESKRLIEYYFDKFVLQGANIPEQDKPEFMALNEEEATLISRFSNKLLAAAKAAAWTTDDTDQLNGLSDAEVQSLAQNATNAGLEGKYMIPIHNTTQQPLLQSLTDRSVREELFRRGWSRTENGDDNDTRDIIVRIAKIRARQAKLLGYGNFAEWKLKDQMAKKPEAAMTFMSKLSPGALEKAKLEAKRIQEMIDLSGEKDADGKNIKLEPWDWNIYAEQVRKADYDLDENRIKPYFLLANVLEKGAFYAAGKLYGITFKERFDIPVYQEDVRVFEVFEENGESMALFYTDFFKRDNKLGGAWMGNVIEQSKLLGAKPVIYNVCNFTKPAPGLPALISFDDVTTLFHEFGHALHGLFANQYYPSLSGTNVARDFVELPSQFNEHWSLYPEVFKNYAIHYETGEPMPEDLAEKLKKTSTFNQGYMLTELLEAALLDMEWHTLTGDETIVDPVKFEQEALDRTGLNIKEIPPRYRSTYFLHIWGNGYAAGYYAYLWAEMLDNDAYSWFEENGGMTRANGQRFRDMILSQGNTQDLEKLFISFRGREPDVKPLLKHRGL